MTILDEIVKAKRKEVEENKGRVPLKLLEEQSFFNRQTLSLKEHLMHSAKFGIIAEIKRRSPSKGTINANVSVEHVSTAYVRAGVSAISVLTDNPYFGGSNEDLITVRKLNNCPVLRKEFIIDEYQVLEAKAIGADAILLIAAVLSSREIVSLTSLAHSIGLEVLMEIHNEKELIGNLNSGADLIGVNNRDLTTFKVHVDVSKQLASKIPDSVVKISESGISSPDTVIELMQYGYKGFLMGESFMKHSQPGEACQTFIDDLRRQLDMKRVDS